MTASRATPSSPFAALGIAAAVFAGIWLAYGPVLDNFFFPIDDPQMLWDVGRGQNPTPHFRPLYAIWNSWLLALFGKVAMGWYAASLLVHGACALLVAFLAGRITGRGTATFAAGISFALFYSPHQAVLWISANCGLMAVLFVLLSAAAWVVRLDLPEERRALRATAYVAALLFLVVAMGFKEDCVLAGPLLFGLELCRRGARTFKSPRALTAYVPPALLAAAYLSRALDPSLWADSGSVGEYALGAGLIGELFQNAAWLFWPRAVEPEAWSSASAWGGAGLVGILAVLGYSLRRSRPLILLGLVLLLFAMFPVLPGPFAVAGSRYAYAAAVGAALLITGLFDLLWSARVSSLWRVALATAGIAWIALHGLSIRSVGAWRYANQCARLERMVESSRPVLGESAVTLVSPPIFNASDYRSALVLWAEIDLRDLSIEVVTHDAAFLARFEPDGDLAPAEHAVYAFHEQGDLYRMRALGPEVTEPWARTARENSASHGDESLSIVHYRRPKARHQEP